MASDLLFELGTEELPSASVFPLAEALASEMTTRLTKAGIPHGEVQCFATPRRLAIWIKAVSERQEDQSISRKGPALSAARKSDGEPTPALLGFAKSCGVTVDDIMVMETDKGPWCFYEAVLPGADTLTVLPGLLSESLSALPIPKPMRWGSHDMTFSRPVHWAVLLFGETTMRCSLLGVETGDLSYGHRFHHPQAVQLSSPSFYEATLKDAFVQVDFMKRRQTIETQIQALAADAGLEAIIPEALLDEVTSIVEWPVALMVGFERVFLDVPAEALIASMQSHQKCFALRDKQGALAPYFITVSNIQSTNEASVIAGNEKVMRARLSDAAFFFQQDKQKPLHDYRAATGHVLFQAKLGTLLDKSDRLYALMNQWSDILNLSQVDVHRAAFLSKCDLMTGMVGEFPELQGLMGFYYALHDGENHAVALALNEQYWPRFAADALPTSTLGLALSLADRLDTLVGAFAIGQRPTGVKDPFKLRRHALAVIRLLIQLPKAPPLSVLLDQALSVYGDTLVVDAGAMEALRLFILERLYAYYEGQGIRADVVQAVRARQEDDLFDLDKRVLALQAFVNRPEAASLAAACKRVNHLLQHAASDARDEHVNPALFVLPEEHALFQDVERVEQQVVSFYKTHEYEPVLTTLACLREPVDAFFDKVMVMVDDLPQRYNRLSLLARLQAVLQGVAAISLLE